MLHLFPRDARCSRMGHTKTFVMFSAGLIVQVLTGLNPRSQKYGLVEDNPILDQLTCGIRPLASLLLLFSCARIFYLVFELGSSHGQRQVLDPKTP